MDGLKKLNIFSLLKLGLLALVVTSSWGWSKSSNPARKTSELNATKQEVKLTTGLQSVYDIDFEPCEPADKCIRIANSQLIQVQYASDKKQLILTPVKRGDTTITIRDTKGDIRLILNTIVNENNLFRRMAELKDLLRDIEGIDIKIMGEKIVLDGEVVVIGDLNRLYAVISDELYKGLVINLVTVSPVGMQIMAERMQGEINRPNIKVRVFNGLFLIEGSVESSGEADSVLTIARSMLQGFVLPTYALDGRSPIDVKRPVVKDPIIARITVQRPKEKPPEKVIRLTVDFVELSKDYLRNFGFSWIPSLETGGSVSFGQSTTGGVTSAGTGSLSGTIGNLFPKLSSAQNAGYARILEESILLTRSGKQGFFKRTLDIPIEVTNDRGGKEFRAKAVGPSITITPRVQGQGEDVEMDINFNYIGLAGRQGNAPITLDHVYTGTVMLKSGESAAIVNAMSNVISTAFNRDPPGGSTPSNPLFTLLRSKAFQKSKSQFVVFITPQVLESSSTGTEDIKAKYGLKRKR